MELLLYQWSTSAQITSDLLVAIFFVVLTRTTKRLELRPWLYAWLANLGALAVTVAYWLLQPESPWAFLAIRTAYSFLKTLFVLQLIVGAWSFAAGPAPLAVRRRAMVGATAVALAVALLATSINRLGFIQSSVICLCFTAGALLAARWQGPAWAWLAAAFGLRAAFAAVESLAYGSQLTQLPWSSSPSVALFLAAHSSFDMGVEWMIALGCVLTLHRTVAKELMHANAELIAAKESLQTLVDRDALTGLSNRRSLRAIMEQARAGGATILFFDLNDFKRINDRYGHQAGDDCLKRFARVLQTSFRPSDHVVRYAGDEFVVVVQGLTPEHVAERIAAARHQLAHEMETGPTIRFSVGQSYLAPGGEPDQALHAADAAMYAEKEAL